MADIEDKNVENELNTQDEFVFIREKIKARPIDKRKLAINTGLTIFSAVMFGLIACVTFVFLAPVLTDRITAPSKDTQTVTSIEPVIFPEETIEEEMAPEDMLVAPEEIDIDLSELQLLEEQQIKEILSSITFTVADYQNLYKNLAVISQNAMQSIVKVTTVTQDTDWLSDLYEGTRETTGIIVARNDNAIYILASMDGIQAGKKTFIQFANGIRVLGDVGRIDTETGLCTIVIPVENVNQATLDSIKVANLGSSFSQNLVGSPIIAIGSPMGYYGSVSYGIITGNTTLLPVVDNLYKSVTTDIYGSSKASGAIINLRGDVVGVITSKFSKSESKNLVSAIGITELKRTIENLVNETAISYLGIVGTDVPEEAIVAGPASMGAYVMNVAMGSPAMMAGIQSGDIITGIGNINISRFSELVNQLRMIHTENPLVFTILRPVQGEYKEITVEIVLGESHNTLE